jgi:HSP20 family protein
VYRSVFTRDVFAELDRLQREMQEAFDLSPSIRGVGRGGFPALNVGGGFGWGNSRTCSQRQLALSS